MQCLAAGVSARTAGCRGRGGRPGSGRRPGACPGSGRRGSAPSSGTARETGRSAGCWRPRRAGRGPRVHQREARSEPIATLPVRLPMPTAARHAAAPRASAYRGSATSDRAPTIGAPMGVLPTRADSLDELSPQELQIVQMVAGAHQRRHRGTALPLAPYGRVAPVPRVPKLGVTSRAQLASVVAHRPGIAI